MSWDDIAESVSRSRDRWRWWGSLDAADYPQAAPRNAGFDAFQAQKGTSSAVVGLKRLEDDGRTEVAAQRRIVIIVRPSFHDGTGGGAGIAGHSPEATTNDDI